MSERDTPDRSLEACLAECLESKPEGNYRRNLERVVSTWIEWCHDREVTTLDEVTSRTMAQYAGHLRRRTDAQSTTAEGGISASSAWTYYNQVSAFLSWALKWEYIPENPAEKAVAKETLPPRPSSSDVNRQFWTPEQRRAVVTYVDERAREAIDEDGLEAIDPVRNRALVAVLAYTGVRGAEVLRDPRDPRREGLRWEDVSLEDGTMRVLGKNQRYEDTQLPRQAAVALAQLERLLDPEPTWPVFPTLHRPTLSATLRRELASRYTEAELEATLAEHDHWQVLRTERVEPPALSKSGGRSLLKRLSEQTEIPGLEDGSKDYLTLHGARRGVGEALYRTRGAAAAQRALRHADPATTSEMYAHIEASELAEDVSEVFDEES